MKRLLVAGFVLALLVPACALGQSVFNGTWKLDPTTVRMSGGKALVISLKHGMFSRTNATPPFKVKADGQDHAVSGHKGFDTVAVTVVNDHTTREVQKKAGNVVTTATFTVAPDNKTATVELNGNHGTEHVAVTEVMKREGKPKHGTNAVNGSWRLEHVTSASGNVFAPTYKVVGDTLTASNGAGNTYTAKIGGKPVPDMVDGKANGTVAVKMLGKRTLRETYAKNGKVTSTTTLTVLRGGKSMKMVDHNMKTGATTTMIHHKE